MENTTAAQMMVNSTDLAQGSTTMSLQQINRQIYMNHCIYDPLPTAGQIVNSMNVFDMFFHIIMLALATATVAIFIELVYFLQANIKQSARRRFSIVQAALPSVFATSSVVGIFSPGGFIMIDFVSSAFFGFGIHTFLLLTVNYFGGIRQLLLRFKRDNKKFAISTGPLCCFCRCLPKFEMNRKNFTILWYATFQAALLRPIILFFEAVFSVDKSIAISSLVYAGLMVFSMMSGVWAVVILRKASGSYLNQFHITGKYIVFQLILLIANVQPFLIKAFYNSCDLPYTFFAKKITLNYQIMVFEFFVLGLLTRFLYRRVSDNENLERIVEKIDMSDDNHNFASPEKKLLNGAEESANGHHVALTIEENSRSDEVV